MSREQLAEAYQAFAEIQRVAPVELDLVPRNVGWENAALGSDVMSAVEVLLSTYEAAQAAVAKARGMIESPEVDSGDVFELLEAPQRRFITGFKSVFFFVRAYQDAVCALLFELRGQKAGKYTSMAEALKEGKPVRELLDEELPGDSDWLYRWRDDRDKIKRGARFVLFFDGDDNLSISFTHPVGTGMRTEEERIGLPRVIEGLEMSARVAAVAWSHVKSDQLYTVQEPSAP